MSPCTLIDKSNLHPLSRVSLHSYPVVSILSAASIGKILSHFSYLALRALLEFELKLLYWTYLNSLSVTRINMLNAMLTSCMTVWVSIERGQ